MQIPDAGQGISIISKTQKEYYCKLLDTRFTDILMPTFEILYQEFSNRQKK